MLQIPDMSIRQALPAFAIATGFAAACSLSSDTSSAGADASDPGDPGDASSHTGNPDADGDEDWVRPERADVFSPPESASWRYGGGAGYPDRVTPDWPIAEIVSTREDLEAALEAAQPSDVIYVADDASIDLTGGSRPCVPEGVWLAGGRGRDGLPGGELYTTEIVSSAMLEVCGDDARITGLRLIGPDPDECPPTYPNSCSGEDNTGGVNCRDCEPRPVGVRIQDAHGAEVDNNEMAGWSNAALRFDNSLGGSVHHNHIHHTQRQGLGYGVVLYGTEGTEVEIAWNRFNYNRHAVAGSGDAGQSYHAHNNLILEHAIGHVFDMHGSNENTGNESPDAGTRIDIHQNTVLVPDHYSMVIRGRPTEGAWLYDNCLAPTSPEAAALQRHHSGSFHVGVAPDASSSPNDYGQSAADCRPLRWCMSSHARGPWSYRASSSTSLGSLAFGDFSGDGITDVLAVGSGHWRVSEGGTEPWASHNPDIADPVDSVAFGDFNGDGTTDAFRSVGAPENEWQWSKGASEPWQTLNASSISLDDLAFGDFNGDGRTDVFRAGGSRWEVSYGGSASWETLSDSDTPLGELAFGDFNGDGRTDVFRASNGRWEVSYGGVGPWEQINDSTVSLGSLRFADVSGDGKTDVLRRSGTRWLVSLGASTAWQAWRISSDPLGSVHFADFTGDGADDAFATGCL